MRFALLLTLLQLRSVAGSGAGAWTDPNHYRGPESLRGTRYIAERYGGRLRVVGTDNGYEWWALEGTTSGDSITVDFGPKTHGFIGRLSGRVTKQVETVDTPGVQQIHWSDGNVWTMLEAPTVAWAVTDRQNFHVGLFYDEVLHEPETFQGTYYIAEFPPHKLTIVGTDDGMDWWTLTGVCRGKTMSDIVFERDVSADNLPAKTTADVALRTAARYTGLRFIEDVAKWEPARVGHGNPTIRWPNTMKLVKVYPPLEAGCAYQSQAQAQAQATTTSSSASPAVVFGASSLVLLSALLLLRRPASRRGGASTNPSTRASVPLN
jgi:hypothetical protein